MKLMHTNFRAALLGALCALALTACGDSVQVKGRVTNDSGSQTQGLVQGITAAPAPGLGGEGAASATVTVQAQTVLPGGELVLLAESEVAAGGAYTIDVPRGSERVLITALDANGSVVAQGIMDSTAGAQAGVRHAAPMTSESSLEAQVFLAMISEGALPESVDTVDLRARIDAALGAEMAADTSEAHTRAEAVAALAHGVLAAQEAELKAYAEAGASVTQEQLFQASVEASARLDAALDAGDAGEAAWASFWAEVRTATAEVDEQAESEGERAASVSFRAAVKAELGAGETVTTAAIRAAAASEARAADAAMTAILEAGGASQAALDASAEAGVKLRADIRAAADAEAVASAFATWSSSISGSASASVLGTFVEADLVSEVILNASITASATAAATLDTALSAAIESAGAVDAAVLAQGVVSAFDAYHTAVRAQAAALVTFGARAAPATEILIVAQGSFRPN